MICINQNNTRIFSYRHAGQHMKHSLKMKRRHLGRLAISSISTRSSIFPSMRSRASFIRMNQSNRHLPLLTIVSPTCRAILSLRAFSEQVLIVYSRLYQGMEKVRKLSYRRIIWNKGGRYVRKVRRKRPSLKPEPIYGR
jgi:hypothetical protein